MSRVRQPQEEELDDENESFHRVADNRDLAGQEQGMATAEVCRRDGINSATFLK